MAGITLNFKNKLALQRNNHFIHYSRDLVNLISFVPPFSAHMLHSTCKHNGTFLFNMKLTSHINNVLSDKDVPLKHTRSSWKAMGSMVLAMGSWYFYCSNPEPDSVLKVPMKWNFGSIISVLCSTGNSQLLRWCSLPCWLDCHGCHVTWKSSSEHIRQQKLLNAEKWHWKK